jgi:murein DD-endopeptidase MepM/ murein hydrolase activator NlpD
VVTSAGWSEGYGNLIEIRHANGYVTRYGHLRAFAKGIHDGARVSEGEVIGFVGMTGLATAPHLHFELLVGGKQRNPAPALMSTPGEPVGETKRLAFEAVRDRAVAELDAGPRFSPVAQR